MDMLKLHEDALRGTSTAYHEFLLRYKPREAVVYGFVEGKEDPMFYRGLIEQALPAGWEVELIASGSRNCVLQSLADFDWEKYSSQRICFFVDRDLSEFLGTKPIESENLYITDGYSIENDALTFGTFKRMLQEVFNITNVQPVDVENIKTVYESNIKVFQEALGPVMAQIIMWQRAGKHPALNDVDIRPFFHFVGGYAQLHPRFSTSDSRVAHAAQCVGLTSALELERLQVEKEFRDREGLQKFIRGKYSLWFLIESATKLHLSIANVVSTYKEPPKVRVTIGKKNAMVILAPRVRCPESLRSFISKGFVAFCSSPISAGPWRPEKRRTILERMIGLLRGLAAG